MKLKLLEEILGKLYNSSKNVRAITMVVVMACVISFFGTWNSYKYSWLKSRINVHELQLKWIDHIQRDSTPINMEASELLKYEEAKKYFNEHYSTKLMLEENLKLLYAARVQNVLILKVPFFGVSFDVNDLGMVSGLGISLAYFSLIYCLILKRNHLRTTFSVIDLEADEEIKRKLRSIVFMDQVLTVPKKFNRKLYYFHVVPKLFYALPLVVYSIIFLHDISSINLGTDSLLSPNKTMFLMCVSAVFWMLILGMTITCYYVTHKMDKLWKIQYAEDQIGESELP